MKTKTIFYITIPTITVLFFLLAPPNIKDRAISVVTFATSERQCFNFYKPDFNDPDSAYVESSYVWSRENAKSVGSDEFTYETYDAVLRVKTRAKNLMGGYGSDVIECPLINGKFDKSAALTRQLRTRRKIRD